MGLIKGMEELPLAFLQIWRRVAILSRACSTAHLQQHHSGVEHNLRLWASELLQNDTHLKPRMIYDQRVCGFDAALDLPLKLSHETNMFYEWGSSDKGLFKCWCKKWNRMKAWRLSPFWFCFRERADGQAFFRFKSESTVLWLLFFQWVWQTPLPVQSSRPCWQCVTENAPNSANSSWNASWSICQAAAPLQEWGQSPPRHVFFSEMFLYQDCRQASSHLLPISSL